MASIFAKTLELFILLVDWSLQIYKLVSMEF